MTNMTIEQFRQIYEDWKQSGLSVLQYSENTGLTEPFLLLEGQNTGRVLAFILWQFHPGKDVREDLSLLSKECLRQSLV